VVGVSPSRLGLLREHDFRQLFVADMVSELGTQVSLIALPLVAVVSLRATPFEVGALTACGSIAFLLLGLPAGAWVDRMRRRRVMIVGDLGRAVALGSVPLAWWAGVLTMPHLYAVALVTGVLTVFFDVAYQSYLPHLVGRDNLVEGNAKLQGVQSVNHIGGPTVAGFLIQALTAPVAVGADALSFLGSALFVALIRKRETRPVRSRGAQLGREIAEGLRFVLGNRLLRAIAMTTGSSNFFSGVVASMEMVFLAGRLGLAPGVIGLLFSAGAVGGLGGALAARRGAARLGHGRTIWLSVAVCSPFGLLFPLARPGWLLGAVAAALAVSSFGVVVYNVTQVSFRQQITPEQLLGRMNATMRFLVWGTLPLGSLLGAVLGQSVGVREALWVGAAGGCLAFLPTFLSPLRRMRELPGPPASPPDIPAQPGGTPSCAASSGKLSGR
jgi:MFS family permease